MSQRNHGSNSSDGGASSMDFGAYHGAYRSPAPASSSSANDQLLSSGDGSSTSGIASLMMRADSAPTSGVHQLAPSRLGSTRMLNLPLEPLSMLGRTAHTFPASNEFQVVQPPLASSQSGRLNTNYDAPNFQAAPPMGASVGSLTASQLSQHRQQAAISGIRQRLAQASKGAASVSAAPRRSTVSTVSASSLNQLQGHQNLGYPQQPVNPFAFTPLPIPQQGMPQSGVQASYAPGPSGLQQMNILGVGNFAPSLMTSNQMMPPAPFLGQSTLLNSTSLSPQLLAYIGSELARSGVTVAAAIESGVLGSNLSREEVEMIVDAHVAEQTKMAPLLVEGHASILSGSLNAFASNQGLSMNQGLSSSSHLRSQIKFEVPNFGRGSHDSALSGASGESIYGGSSCGEIRDSNPSPQSGPLSTTQVPLFQRKSYH